MYGEADISMEHIENNLATREILLKRGVKPENLPAAEDTHKVRRRLASEEKKSLKNAPKLTQLEEKNTDSIGMDDC